MQGAWSLSRSQRPFWKKARGHPVGLAAGPCAEEKQTYLTCETPPPSRLFASNVNENRLGSSHDSIFAHAARPRRTLPFPSADRSALSRDSSSPWVPPGAGPFGFFARLMFAGVYGDIIQKPGLYTGRLDQINFWCLPLFSETLPAIFFMGVDLIGIVTKSGIQTLSKLRHIEPPRRTRVGGRYPGDRERGQVTTRGGERHAYLCRLALRRRANSPGSRRFGSRSSFFINLA